MPGLKLLSAHIKLFTFAALGVLSLLGPASLSHISPAQAQTPGVNLAQSAAQVNTLTTKLSSDEAKIATLQSDNLILGDQNNHSAYGGLVAGTENKPAGPYSLVPGGEYNTVNSSSMSVGGGSGNAAGSNGSTAYIGNFTSP